jgi:hypothetical protein
LPNVTSKPSEKSITNPGEQSQPTCCLDGFGKCSTHRILPDDRSFKIKEIITNEKIAEKVDQNAMARSISFK